MVWQRPDPPPATSGDSRSGDGEVGDRWEAAARAKSGATKEKTAGSKEPPPHPAPGQATTKGNAEICINCSLPGLLKEEERAKLQAGVKRLAHAAAALADRSLPRGRSLLGDREGIQIG
ncbi:uncharacterized protein [Triticum aestivum]|uniref:uncharacterized protein isoform X2 n=1 Tax=Triticum aestivum TaxID=4565 RepID=UPI001D00F14E|nr:uncharacterized protein LOC123138221 isoform X2 [Triticum aestivum]